MPHHVYARPGGNWAGVTVVDLSWFTLIDTQLFGAISGDTGGTWAPTNVITIGGSGVDIVGPFNAPDAQSIAVQGTLDMDDGSVLNVKSAAEMHWKSGSDSFWEAGSTCTFNDSSDLVLNGDVGVGATGVILVASGGQVFTAAGSAVDFGGEVHFHNTVTMLDGARVLPRVTDATNTNVTIGVDDTDVLIFANDDGGGYTATLKIATGSAPQKGESISIQKGGLMAGTLTVKNEASAANVIAFTGAVKGHARVMFDGTMWRLAANYNGTPGADAA